MFHTGGVYSRVNKYLAHKHSDCIVNNFLLKNLLDFDIGHIKIKHVRGIKMSTDLLEPPKNLNGMKLLDKDAFKKTIGVPCLEVEKENINTVINLLKKYFFKMTHIKPVKETNEGKQIVLLNPNLVQTWSDLGKVIEAELKKIQISEKNFSSTFLDLGYENWCAASLLKAVLPKDELPLRSFSNIGHIIHLNLKDHLLEYKHIIAQILLDKVPTARTVVYKKSIIDNTYRNFEMEVICGEPNFMVFVKENKCNYKFDFSKVYWNPRLSTEHSRIVDMLEYRDVLFDVFAGVGPFSIPASCKGCTVFANDLNPESFKWLNFNITLNKRAKNITTFNKDGSDFILNVAKENLLKIWQDECFTGKIHFVMNLPALALTFIKYFKGLISKNDLNNLKVEKIEKCLPIIHCHFFVKQSQTVQQVFEEQSGIILNNYDQCFHFVRQVSDGKAMQRATFEMPINYLLKDDSNRDIESGEPLLKRHCKGGEIGT